MLTRKNHKQPMSRNPEGSIFQEATQNHSKSRGYKFRKTGNHAIELYSEKFLWQKIQYIHSNPVVENYVSQPEHWL
jgi:hypothetical protein